MSYFLKNCPSNLQFEVINYLNIKDLHNLSSTSSYFHKTIPWNKIASTLFDSLKKNVETSKLCKWGEKVIFKIQPCNFKNPKKYTEVLFINLNKINEISDNALAQTLFGISKDLDIFVIYYIPCYCEKISF